MASVGNISLEPGSRLDLDNQTLKISGTVSSNGNINAINGNIEFEDTTLNGNFDLRICDYATRLEPTDFVQLVLTLDITDK